MKNTFVNIYDNYCPMLYGIAVQVTNSKQIAERILLLSFEKLYKQNTDWRKANPFCIDLIKLIIQTAQEEMYPGITKCNFRIKQFENTPILHRLISEQLSLETYCIEYDVTRPTAILYIRDEFMLLQTIVDKNNVDDDMATFHSS